MSDYMSPRIREIFDFLRNAQGEPYSIRRIHEVLDEKYDIRSITKDLRELASNPSYNVKSKVIGRSEVYWHSNILPSIEGMDQLNTLALNRQYPIHQIIAKINDIKKVKGDYFRPEDDLESGPHRSSYLISETKEEVLWWAGDFSIFQEIRPYFVKFLENGGSIKILMNITQFSHDTARKILDLCADYPEIEMRHWESQWRGTICDRKIVWLVEKLPRRSDVIKKLSDGTRGKVEDFEYLGWLIDSKVVRMEPWVQWFCTIWDAHWEKSKISPSPSKILEQLEDHARNIDRK